jgi:hypothetical protein
MGRINKFGNNIDSHISADIIIVGKDNTRLIDIFN